VKRWNLAGKKVVFITLSVGKLRAKGANPGVAALVPVFKKYSYEVSVLEMRDDFRKEDFLREIDERDPSIVGFSCTSPAYRYLVKYSNMLAERPEILQIAGGVHVTLDPRDVLSRTSVHGACIGEGEIPLEDLLGRIERGDDISKSQGFFWKFDDVITENPRPPFVEDLTTLAFQDFSVFARDVVVKDWDVDRNIVVEACDRKKYITVQLSRGCPYRCPYCCNSACANVYPSPQKYYRIPSVEYSVTFLEKMLKDYPEVNFIETFDDLLIANKEWFISFAQAYKKRIHLPYKLDGRAEHITPEIIKALKDSGCVQVAMGIESGDEGLRQNLLKRPPSNEFIIERCRLITDAGLELMSINMIGLPFETKRQMKATLEFNKRINPHFGTVQFFHPYKRTELYDLCQRHGLLKNEGEMINIGDNFERPFIKLPDATEDQCRRLQKKLLFFFFMQTLRYRCRMFLFRRRGLRKVALVGAVIKIFGKGVKLYFQDYLKKYKKADVSGGEK